MKSIEIFKNYQLKLNKLDSEDNIDISPGEFVIIYNEEQVKWFETKFRNVSTRYIDDVQNLVVVDKALNKSTSGAEYDEFHIPPDYFDYVRSYSVASKGECLNRIVYNNEVKLANLGEVLKDAYNKPSFEYQETLMTIAENKLQVYKTDFSIDSVFCTYYKYPTRIDILGYTKNGVPSTNIDSELDDNQIFEIIDLAVAETQRRYNDIEGIQLSQSRK